MEYVYATLMLDALNKEITEQNLKRVIEAAGGTPDEIQIKQLLTALKGVNIKEAMKTAAAVPVVAAAPAHAAEKREAKKEEPEEKEVKEEEALEGLGALFG